MLQINSEIQFYIFEIEIHMFIKLDIHPGFCVGPDEKPNQDQGKHGFTC